jgi:hypothetical protein
MGTKTRAPTEERLRAGRGLRAKVARKSQAGWTPSAKRPDPVDLLIESDARRIPKLLPIRYGRMRQSRDMKIPMPVNAEDPADLAYFADALGAGMAHARTGDPAMVAGYLGRNDRFDDSIVRFTSGYAEQTEPDYAMLLKAIKSGRVKAAK